jgi:hypothetical protein
MVRSSFGPTGRGCDLVTAGGWKSRGNWRCLKHVEILVEILMEINMYPLQIGGWILGLQFWTKWKTGRDWKGEKTTPTSADPILPGEICVQWLSNGSEKISQGVELKTRSFTQYVYIYIYITRIYIYIIIYILYIEILYYYRYLIDLLCPTYN